MVKRILLILAIITSFNTYAAGPTVFVGAGTNYAGLGALRVGFNDWEAGIFAQGSFGVNKIFRSSKNYYATLGFGMDSALSPALLGGVGFNYFSLLGFGLRGELYSITTYNGKLSGAGTLVVSWNF